MDDQRGVSMLSTAHFPSDPFGCTWACVCLKRHLVVCWLTSPVVESFFFWHSHWWWGERLSTAQVQRLRPRRPRVLRRKRDCTPALFLTFSRWPSTMSPGTSEEEGLAPSPFLLTVPASTSEEEGQGFLLATSVCTSCPWPRRGHHQTR